MKGRVTFKTSSGEKAVRFTVNALCDLEEASGLSVDELVQNLQTRPSLGLLRQLFAAGLSGAEERPVPLSEAGEILQEIGLERTGEIVGAAVAGGLGAETSEDPPKKPTAQGG